jgi:hypothetical protein
VEARTNREWLLDAAELEAKLKKAYNFDDLYEKKLRSVADIERRVGKPRFKLLEGEIAGKPKGRAVLAPGTDRRPPLGSDVIKDFEVIPEE